MSGPDDVEDSSKGASGPDDGANRADGSRSFALEVFANVKESSKQNRVSAAISFFVGLTLVLLYNFGGDSVRDAFEAVVRVKETTGMAYSVVATGIFGGLLPSLLQVTIGKLPEPHLPNFVFNIVIFALHGLCVDRLYFIQAGIFGSSTDVETVVCKVLVDQLIWNPFISVPCLSVVFRWRDQNFGSWRDVLRLKPLLLSYCSMLLSVWITWVPGTTVIYTFPTALQIPAFNVILFMFSILLALVSRNATAKTSDPDHGARCGADGLARVAVDSSA